MSTENGQRMSDTQYIENEGCKCPYCHGPNVEVAGQFESDSTAAWRPSRCPDCGEEWTDQYVLTGYSPVE